MFLTPAANRLNYVERGIFINYIKCKKVIPL